MKTKRAGQSGFFNVRALVAFVLCLAGVVLAMFSFTPLEGNRRGGHGSAEGLQRYMPVPGGDPDDLNRMEEEWNNRLTYPTGIFDPAWVRAAIGDLQRLGNSRKLVAYLGRSCGDQPGAKSTLYSVVLPSKCSLSASASSRVWWTTPSR